MKSKLTVKQIAELMEEVPPWPKGFYNWIKKSAFKESKYIFYKRTHGLCSSCGKDVVVKKARHNKTGRCPLCKARVKYKAINKAKTYQDTQIVSIIQRMGDRYVVRYMKVFLTFKNREDTSDFPKVKLETLTDPTIVGWEGSREIISIINGVTIINEFEELWNWKINDFEWRNEHKRSTFFNKELLRASVPYFYKKNLKGILKNTKWQYSGLNYLKIKEINITEYLYAYEDYPIIEMLAKTNCNRLLKQIVYMVTYCGGLCGYSNLNKKMLGLDKNYFKVVQRLNLGTSGVDFVQFLFEKGEVLDDKHIIWAINNCNTETFSQLLRFISPQKIINYVERYCKTDRRHFITMWRDYLNQCQELEFNIKDDFILFPKDLESKHQEYTELIDIKELEIFERGINMQYKHWNPLLAYASGVLGIRVARNNKEIIEEGQKLKHCVGIREYREKMSKGETLIMFLLKNGKSFYTIEFNPHKVEIIQNRGYRNKEPTKEVERFINKWKINNLMNINKSQKAAI